MRKRMSTFLVDWDNLSYSFRLLGTIITTIPVHRDRFIMYNNGCIIAGVISFRRRGPMLSGPAPFLLFKLLINPFAARPKNIIPPKTVENSQYRR